MRRVATLVLAILLCIVPAGCVSTYPPLPPPPGETVRAQLGTIGVITADSSPSFATSGPAKGRAAGALRGAGMGSVDTIIGGAIVGGGYGLILGIFLAPVGAAVGTVVGAIKSEPSAKIAEQEAAARRIVARGWQEALRDRVADIGREHTRYSFLVVSARSPGRDGDGVYAGLAGNGIQSALEVRVDDVHLAGWGIDPPLRLRVTTRARLVRTVGGAELYGATLVYEGHESHTLEQWVALEGQLLHSEADRAWTVLATKIVDEIFLTMDLPAWGGGR